MSIDREKRYTADLPTQTGSDGRPPLNLKTRLGGVNENPSESPERRVYRFERYDWIGESVISNPVFRVSDRKN